MLKRKSIWAGVLASIATILFIPSVYATTTGTTKFSVDIENTVLELTIPATPAVIDLNPTMTGASFGSTSINVKVATNNITGYQLTMTPTNSQTNTSLIRTELVGIEQTYREIETLELTDPVSTGYPEADFTANRWGYKITGDNYYGIDPNNTTVSHPAWVTNEPTNGTNHNLTLAAKVDAETVSGAYETTLSFNVVTIPNTIRDTIVFNGNGADSGSMSNQSVYQGEPNKLSTNAYSKNGYVFNGWNTTSGGLGTGYGDGEEYTPTISNSAKTITLYAQWLCDSSVNTCDGVPSIDGSSGAAGRTLQAAYEQAYINTPGQFPKDEGGYKHGLYVPHKNAQGKYDGTYFEATQQSDYDGIPAKDLRFAIQDIDLEVDGQSVCERTTVIGSEAYVLDLRDYKSYWVAKLADGRCWMTQNLDFDLDSTRDYTNEDTDIGWDGTKYVSTTWRPASSTVHSVSDYVDSTTTPQSLDLGNYYYDGSFTYDTCNIVQGGCGYSANMSETTREHGHIGNHYNAPATFAINNTTQVTLSETDRSICPKGWKLPNYTPSTSTYDITTLYQAYGMGSPGGTGILFESPLYFVTAGVPSADLGGGNMGWYRYGSLGNSGGTMIILYHGTMPWAGGNYFEQSLSVRCVAR